MFHWDPGQVYSGPNKETLLGEISAEFQPATGQFSRVADKEGKLVEIDLVAITRSALSFEIREGRGTTKCGSQFPLAKTMVLTWSCPIALVIAPM